MHEPASPCQSTVCIFMCLHVHSSVSLSQSLWEQRDAKERKGNVCVLKVVLEYFYSRCVSSKNRQKWKSRHYNQRWKKRQFQAIKNVFTRAVAKWRAILNQLRYFPFFNTFHICFASKQRTTLQWITKGLYSSLPPLLQSARPTTTSAAYHHVYGWEVARHTAGTGRNRTLWNKKTLCHLHCWHFPHQWESASICCSPLALCRIWSCRTVMPPCGLCAGTSVSHMTCVECSWNILLPCVWETLCVFVCLCWIPVSVFSSLDSFTSALAWLHEKGRLCLWCSVQQNTITWLCYSLALHSYIEKTIKFPINIY